MSSYRKNNYNSVFKSLVFSLNPKKIVEIGVFNGFSLDCFIDTSDEDCEVYGYDLFEEYKYKHEKFNFVRKKYSSRKGVSIAQMDFQEVYRHHDNNSIDILHIDISNNGDTYKFAIDNYMPKVSKEGVMLLEGGSVERDNCQWMKDFKFPKIRPVIKEIKKDYKAITFEPYPSLTIIKK
jgi:predicted O-methyltransferase YrrM